MIDGVVPADARRVRCGVLFRDRFIYVVFDGSAEISLQDARDVLQTGRELHGNQPAPCVVDLRGLRSMSAEARAFLAGPGGVSIAPAVGIVVSSPLSRAIGNFYLGFNRPRVPTRLFTSYAAAESWLGSYVLERAA